MAIDRRKNPLPGTEQLTLPVSPDRLADLERAVEQNGGNWSARADSIWNRALGAPAVKGKTRNLVFEPNYNPPDNQPPSNNPTDLGSDGFCRPIAATINLRHAP